MKADMLKLSKIKELGFALVEMIIVLAIIIMLTGLMLANLRGGQKKSALRRAAQQVILDIRRAQSMTLEAREYGDEVPSGGYGIYFNTSEPVSYKIFADCDNDRVYDDMGTPCSPSLPEKVENIELKENISVNSITLDSGPASSIAIVFLPPDPVTFINGSSGATITLENTDGETANAYVTIAGQIEIQ